MAQYLVENPGAIEPEVFDPLAKIQNFWISINKFDTSRTKQSNFLNHTEERQRSIAYFIATAISKGAYKDDRHAQKDKN